MEIVNLKEHVHCLISFVSYQIFTHNVILERMFVL